MKNEYLEWLIGFYILINDKPHFRSTTQSLIELIREEMDELRKRIH